MQATDVLSWAVELGVTLEAAGDKLRYMPREAAPPEFVEALRENKPALLALLTEGPTGAEVADALDACMRLGQQLAQGKVKALRCGITGQECHLCCGIPCLGSTPFDEQGG